MNNKIEQEFQSALPHINPADIQDFCRGLPLRFFKAFDSSFAQFLCESMANISKQTPFNVYTSFKSKNAGDITIMTYDYDFCFSVFVGLISSLNFNIEAGSFYSYESKDTLSKQDPLYKKLKKIYGRRPFNLKRKKIIYTFSGRLPIQASKEIFQRGLQSRLSMVIDLLEKRTDASTLIVREHVHEWVTDKIKTLKQTKKLHLHSTEIKVSNRYKDATKITISTIDTPFFLYALTLPFNYLNINISAVEISTQSNFVTDILDVTTIDGEKITNKTELDKIKLIIILLKQFAYFSHSSANPFRSLHRFVELIQSVFEKDNQHVWIQLLSSDGNLKKLAKVLGASDFLWEDFIRIHTESLLPILKPRASFRLSELSYESLSQKLSDNLKQVSQYDQKIEVINTFKDKWITTIDLYHILKELDFRTYSKHLTILADLILSTTCMVIEEKLIKKHGVPLTTGGYSAEYAIVGLGKLGGHALGYASDIEFMFIYSDEGETNGPEPIKSSEYFNMFTSLIKSEIKAKRDGIFSIDLRLRPYGKSGPKSVSVAALCQYFSPDGDAYLYERMALVRLRFICGSETLGKKIEGLRSEFVYQTKQTTFEPVFDLRLKQIKDVQSYDAKGKPLFNAKFSPGGLVDVEYTVQVLQMIHGYKHQSLQTPSIHQALEVLGNTGIIHGKQAALLIEAYTFFRRLINGLRMLRGHAKDLTVPAKNSSECLHLAKRIGYVNDKVTANKQLILDLNTYSSIVRGFVEQYFHVDYMPNKAQTVADMLAIEQISNADKRHILSSYGFKDPERAVLNLEQISTLNQGSPHFMQLLIYGFNKLRRIADPDRALNNWERFLSHSDSSERTLQSLSSELHQLDMLFDIFSSSQFLADSLVRNPSLFFDVTSSETNLKPLKRGQIYKKILTLGSKNWMDEIRILRRQEIMKIAIKDICFQTSIETITRELSYLAEGFIQSALAYAWKSISTKEFNIKKSDLTLLEEHLCILAFGKLGGTELNYSSDIDIVAIHSDAISIEMAEPIYSKVLTTLRNTLSQHTAEGFTYRVDFNLRPYGKLGKLVANTHEFLTYYQEDARLWEYQALLKARPVAGNWWIGFDVLHDIRLHAHQGLTRDLIIQSIRDNRKLQLAQISHRHIQKIDIKNGPNGIRSIEFLVQGLQLIHLKAYPELYCSKTIISLKLLKDFRIISHADYNDLKNAYILFRRVEHFLQILEDRQTHHLPNDASELKILAKKTLGSGATTEELNKKIQVFQEKISVLINHYFKQ